jgi:hypothetical protein
MSNSKKNTTHAGEPVWFMCEVSDEWYCAIHDKRAKDCKCPDIEDWPFDPRTGGPIPPAERGKAL